MRAAAFLVFAVFYGEVSLLDQIMCVVVCG